MQSGIVMLYIMPNNSISTGLILLAPTVLQYIASYDIKTKQENKDYKEFLLNRKNYKLNY